MIYDYYKHANQKNYFKIVIGILAIISLALVVGVAYGIFSEFIQVREIGDNYTKVFWTNFRVKIIAQVVSFCVIFIVFLISTLIIRAYFLRRDSSLVLIKRLAPIILLTFIISFAASTFIRETVYSRFLLFANSTAFNKADPIFNQDIGYYIFQRPFLISLVDSFQGVWLFQTVYTFIAYLILLVRKGMTSVQDVIHEKGIVIHNVVNIIIFFLIKAATYKFRSEDILYSRIGDMAGAGYTDIMVWLKYFKAAPVILIAVVVITIILLSRGKIKASLLAIAVVPATWILVLLISGLVQGVIVSPNEAVIEKKYFEYNMTLTRDAYNLNHVTEREFPVQNDLTAKDLAKNAGTINNIRITDFPATLTVLNQLQGIRNYYHFFDTDVTTYNLNGNPTAVSLAVRELNKENLDDTAKTYINKKFRYTHGFGVAMNPVNKITEQGQPDFIIKDIPPKSVDGALQVTQPRIYFGETTNDYVIVDTKQKELDYAEGQQDVEFSYDGKAGIKLNFLNRLIFAINNGDLRMLVSGYITSDSKILLNRNILQRVRRVAPFLQYDTDPYIVITKDGKLKWVIDAYTTSEYYPYSQENDNINYIRNSVKAVVDAYDGTVEFYIADSSDPIVNSYNRIYPALFKKEPIPEDIAQHIKYPEQLFKIQAEIYKKYHMTNATAFYNKADLWAIAKEKYHGEIKNVEPYYNVMKISDNPDDREELVLMLPYTLVNKDNMVSWLAVRSQGQDYGQLVSYEFPKGMNVYGPLQIENLIDSDPNISKEMTLWGQGGSNVIRGNMLVIPIMQSLLYVEPIYITSENQASLPQVKKIAVAFNDQIAMESTLDKALGVIFGTQKPETPPAGDTIKDVVERALKAYQDMRSYNQQNDWENSGKSMKQLDGLMGTLDQRKDEIK